MRRRERSRGAPALRWARWTAVYAALLAGACGDSPLPPEQPCGASEVPYNGRDDDCNPATRDDDLDGDGFAKLGGGDCNDNDKTIFPGATEVPYDGIDQDCSGKDLADYDKDGYDSDKVSGGTDCDDNNANINPKGKEICGDTIDQDCDGYDLSCNKVDNDKDGYSPNQGDCDDNNKEINPGMTEVPYNGVDEDCNKLTRDDDLDDDSYNKVGGGDCDDANKDIHPGATEIPYDGIDQDCSGKDLTDKDKDGHDSTTVSGGDDCDDDDAKIYPGAAEIPYDTIDQDCDGSDLITSGVISIVAAQANQSLENTVAVASSGSNFLVVWRQQNYNGSTWTYDVRSQLLSSTGGKVGGPAVLFASATSTASGPVVAGDGTDFYVAWRFYEASTYKLMIRKVSGGGVPGGVIGTIYSTTNSLSTPMALAYSGGTYALVLREYISPNYLIRAFRFDGNGLYQGLSSVYSSDLSGPSAPHIAAGSAGYLVTWHESNSASSYDVSGRLITAAGALTTPTFPVSNNVSTQRYPRAAYDGQNYLVAWYDYRSTNYDIYGQAISPGGSPVYTTLSNNLEISSALNTQDYPDVVYCNGRYLTIFRDSRYTGGYVLSKQAVGTDGQLKDTTASKNVTFYASGKTCYYPRAVCAGQQALVVWVESESVGYAVNAILTAP